MEAGDEETQAAGGAFNWMPRTRHASSSAMLSVKEAAQVAFEYFDDLYEDAPVSSVLLEEVEQVESGNGPLWHITLGFTDESSRGGAAVMASKPRRYKRFEIDAETGEVKAMKIRSVEHA